MVRKVFAAVLVQRERIDFAFVSALVLSGLSTCIEIRVELARVEVSQSQGTSLSVQQFGPDLVVSDNELVQLAVEFSVLFFKGGDVFHEQIDNFHEVIVFVDLPFSYLLGVHLLVHQVLNQLAKLFNLRFQQVVRVARSSYVFLSNEFLLPIPSNVSGQAVNVAFNFIFVVFSFDQVLVLSLDVVLNNIILLLKILQLFHLGSVQVVQLIYPLLGVELLVLPFAKSLLS